MSEKTEQRLLSKLVADKKYEVRALSLATDAIKLAVDSAKLTREFLETDLVDIPLTKLTNKQTPGKMISIPLSQLDGIYIAISFEYERERAALAKLEHQAYSQKKTEELSPGQSPFVEEDAVAAEVETEEPGIEVEVELEDDPDFANVFDPETRRSLARALDSRLPGECHPESVDALWCKFHEEYEMLPITDALRQVVSRSGKSPIEYFRGYIWCITKELQQMSKPDEVEKSYE